MLEEAIKEMMTPKQWSVFNEWIDKDPRHTILEGAVRSGKTVLGIILWNQIVSQTKDRLYIMTGQTISSLKRNVLDDLSKYYGVDTHLNINSEFNLYGNRVACFGSDKSDSYKSMRGLTASGWYANEVILSHQNSVLEAFARCSEADAKIIWETNPDKPTHYIKTNYIDRSGQQLIDGSYDILSYHFQLEDNTFLDHNYLESLKNSIPKGTIYDRQILGLWHATEKAIYNHYDIVDRVLRTPDKVIYGLDFGYNNPSALVRISFCDNEPYIEGCFLKTQLTNNELVEEVKRHVNNREHAIYCDSAEPDKIRSLQDAGLNAYSSNKSVLEGINTVKEYKVHLVNSDVNLIQSFESYEFMSNAQGEIMETPVKYNDHYCLVGATKIMTLDGIKRMDSLTLNDYVLTRKGFKRILRIFDNGYKQVKEYNIYKYKIKGTQDHKVITTKGKKELHRLTQHDTLYTLSNKECYKCQLILKKLLHLTGLSLEDIQSQKESQKEIITDAVQSIIKKESDIYIKKYGKQKMELYQKSMSYIIRILTRWIIGLKILNVFLLKNIKSFIMKTQAIYIKKRLDRILMKLEKRHVNGMDQKKVYDGIKNMLKDKALGITVKTRYVLYVIKNILQRKSHNHFVPMLANQSIEESTNLMTSKNRVFNVMRNSYLTNIRNKSIAPGLVQEQRVYNLTIQDQHEYYANNILVSNCDAVRYALHTDKGKEVKIEHDDLAFEVKDDFKY